MDFQTPKFREFALLNNHYQISKNKGNQNFKLSRPAWSLQKLALKRMNYFTNRSYRKAISKFWVILFIWIQQFVRFKRYLTFSASDLWHLWHSIRVFLHGKISKVAADAEHLTLSMGRHLCMTYFVIWFKISKRRVYPSTEWLMNGGFDRRSRPEVFYKKGIPKIFAELTGKHLCRRLFFNRCFLLIFARFLRASFLYYITPLVAASASNFFLQLIIAVKIPGKPKDSSSFTYYKFLCISWSKNCFSWPCLFFSHLFCFDIKISYRIYTLK